MRKSIEIEKHSTIDKEGGISHYRQYVARSLYCAKLNFSSLRTHAG